MVNINTNKDYGNYENTDIVSTSKLNAYIPFYAMLKGTVIKNSDDLTIVYGLPNFPSLSEYRLITKYSNAVAHMCDRTRLATFRTTRNSLTYVLTKGFLGFVDENHNVVPLIVLTVKSDSLQTLDKDNLDKSKFCLLINNRVYNSQHALMYKNMRKYYVDTLTLEGVDILYTNDINKWIYNDTKFIPKFNSILDLQKHLSTITNLALDIEYEETSTETGTSS